jgi:hypothetical protein
MDNHFPDLPTVPMPAAKPQQKRRKLWLLLALLIGAVVVLCVSIGMINSMKISQHPQAGQTTMVNGTAGVQQSGQVAGTAGGPATGTASAGSTAPAVIPPTPQPGLPSVTHGKPHIGGLFSDFVGTYGTPSAQGDASGQNFWVGADQTIDINASRNEQGVVTQLTILGPSTWTDSQARSYCLQFLPTDAVADSALEYHSKVGKITLGLQAQSCQLSLVRA